MPRKTKQYNCDHRMQRRKPPQHAHSKVQVSDS